MIRKLIVAAVLALLLVPLVSLYQLDGLEARASVRLVNDGGVHGLSFDALLAATRL